MSLITELVGLIDNLDKKLTDRKMIEAFLPIKRLMLDIEREQFTMERRHQEEIAALKSHLDELLALPKVTYINEVYVSDDGSIYCTRCLDADRKAIRLKTNIAGDICPDRVQCPECENYFR